MEQIRHDISEIAHALHCLASGPYPKRIRPDWEIVAEHIAVNRFPEAGFTLRPTLASLAVRRMVLNYNPEQINYRDVALLYAGRPNLLVAVNKSYGSVRDEVETTKQPGFLEDCSVLRETYHLLLISQADANQDLQTLLARGEGLVLHGSPSKLFPYIQARGENGYTQLKPLKNNHIPASIDNHTKSVIVRISRRIGL